MTRPEPSSPPQTRTPPTARLLLLVLGVFLAGTACRTELRSARLAMAATGAVLEVSAETPPGGETLREGRAVDLVERCFRRLDAGESLKRAPGVEILAGARRVVDELSPREHEVLALVASGLSNQEIAERLYLSLHTVKRHVANILTKLDLPSRTAAAALAVRRGLLDGR